LNKQAIDVLKQKGATIVEVELLKATEKPGEGEYNVLLYEFKDGVNRYLSASNA